MSQDLFRFPNIPISDDGLLSQEAYDQYNYLTADEQMSYILSTRPPRAELDDNLKFVSVRNPPSQPNGDESEFTFQMHGKQITLPLLHYGKAEKFTISVVKNGMSIDEFTNRYVRPSIRDWLKPGTCDITFRSSEKVAWLSKVPKQMGIEYQVEQAYNSYLHNPLRDVILKNVGNLQENSSSLEQFHVYYKRKQTLYNLRSLMNPETEHNAAPSLEPWSGFQISLKHVGINCTPDYSLGLGYSFNGKIALILPMAIGEIKTPYSGIGNTYQILRGIPNTFKGKRYSKMSVEIDNNCVPINFLRHERLLDKMLSTFQQTLTKLVTEAVHSGVKKMIISDYTSILFIELNEDFIVGENKSLIKKYPLSTNSASSNESQDLEGTTAFIRDVYAHCVALTHICIPTSNPLIRTYLLSFFWQSNQERGSQLKFQSRVDEFLLEIEKRRERVSYGKSRNNSTDTSTDFNSVDGRLYNSGMSSGPGISGSRSSSETGNPTSRFGAGSYGQYNHATMSESGPPSENTRLFSATDSLQTNHTNVSEILLIKKEFCFNEDLFLKEFRIHLDKMIVYEICCGRGLNSQTIVVKSTPFLEALGGSEAFNLDLVPDTSVAKIFDSDYSSHSISKSAERAINEVIIYDSAKSLMGDIIPYVYTYGLFRDSTIKSGLPYDRYQGPYILMEDLSKNVNDSIMITKDVQKNIFDLYMKLHLVNIIHNDVKVENLIFLDENVVKIIDFSHSYKSMNVLDHLKEMTKVKRIFGRTGILLSTV